MLNRELSQNSPSPVSPVSTNVDTFKLAWAAEWYGTRGQHGKGHVADNERLGAVETSSVSEG